MSSLVLFYDGIFVTGMEHRGTPEPHVPNHNHLDLAIARKNADMLSSKKGWKGVGYVFRAALDEHREHGLRLADG